MTKRKTTYKFCPWQLSEESRRYDMQGLRGKYRSAAKVAITRALENADSIMTEAEKDERLQQTKRIGDRLDAKMRKLALQMDEAADNARREIDGLFPEHPSRLFNKSRFHNDSGKYWDEEAFRVLIDGKLDKIGIALKGVISGLQTQQRTDKKSGGPCGHTPPSARTIKSVVKDPKLKAVLDTFTTTVSKLEDE
jgi:hypothetical protein